MKNSILDKNTQNVTKINYGTRTLCVELLIIATSKSSFIGWALSKS